MGGIKEAMNNPELLAQLMMDLQDPEIMEEAKKMRESPEFQAEMKEMTGTDAYKEAIQKTKQVMEDPNEAAKLQAQMEHMVQRGEDSLTQKAGDTMKEALKSFSDPEVLSEAKKMFSDNKFKEQLQQM